MLLPGARSQESGAKELYTHVERKVLEHRIAIKSVILERVTLNRDTFDKLKVRPQTVLKCHLNKVLPTAAFTPTSFPQRLSYRNNYLTNFFMQILLLRAPFTRTSISFETLLMSPCLLSASACIFPLSSCGYYSLVALLSSTLVICFISFFME